MAERARAERIAEDPPARAALPAEERTPAPAATTGGLIVEDDAVPMPGQMRKSEFLEAAKTESCAAADQALAEVGRDTDGCPYVERTLARYSDQPAAQIERVVLRFAPAARGATDAHDYVHALSARFADGARTWAQTGQLPDDLPEGMGMDMLGGGGLLGALGGAFGGALSAIGSLLFMGEGRGGVDHPALAQRLGPGRPLEGGAKTRMERAFGYGFDRVRVHDDTGAARLSRDLRAHAFTLGDHVAFAHGRYQPGTPRGDAVIAHELAHVVQQHGAAAKLDEPIEMSAPRDAIEADADHAAERAMSSLYGAGEERSAQPQLSSRLRLSRCNEPEDWNFTPQEQGARTAKGDALTFGPDSAWFPPAFRANLLTTLNTLLDPARQPAATTGVRVGDFFHGHVGIPGDLPPELAAMKQGHEATSQSATVGALGTDRPGDPTGITNRVTAENLPGYTKAVTGTIEPSAKMLLETSLKYPGVVVIYHTLEGNKPQQMKFGGAERNFMTPLGGSPSGFNAPDLDSASSVWKNEDGTRPNAPYSHIVQFAFLIDQDGVVHVRPWTGDASLGMPRELLTVTGIPKPQ